MTPQEAKLVDELFNRLAQLETAQRDTGAERLIADDLRRAPHAVYALVQTVLLQDEALKRVAEHFGRRPPPRFTRMGGGDCVRSKC